MPSNDHVPWRTVAFPVEHGGWGFLFEPILLGMLLAPTAAGLGLSVMIVASFLLRHPVKLFWRHRRRLAESPRGRAAWKISLVYALFALGGLALAVAAAGPTPLLPLLVMAPLVLVYLFYDSTKQARRLLPELAGPLGLAAIAPAVAVAAGWSWLSASALWIILTARTIPSIFYVRARLRLERGKPTRAAPVIINHVIFTAVVALLAWRGLAPSLAVVAVGVLFARAALGLSPLRRSAKATRIGFSELGYGLFYVAMTVVGFWVEW
ncbi:MAG: YwiC-like family protein [Candidatus Krumholzibacteria bacterium]